MFWTHFFHEVELYLIVFWAIFLTTNEMNSSRKCVLYQWKICFITRNYSMFIIHNFQKNAKSKRFIKIFMKFQTFSLNYSKTNFVLFSKNFFSSFVTRLRTTSSKIFSYKISFSQIKIQTLTIFTNFMTNFSSQWNMKFCWIQQNNLRML